MTAGEGRRKAPDAFRTIGEAAAELGVATHVLRFWEGKFPGLKPMKRAGNRRYYRPADMAVLGQIKQLLHDEGYTIKGAQRALRLPGDLKVPEAEQSAPTLFDSAPEMLGKPTSETGSLPLESLPIEQLRRLAVEAKRLAAECAIVAAGNRPPTSMD